MPQVNNVLGDPPAYNPALQVQVAEDEDSEEFGLDTPPSNNSKVNRFSINSQGNEAAGQSFNLSANENTQAAGTFVQSANRPSEALTAGTMAQPQN